ncbi:translation initiation factor IF-2 [uncultured Streptomyces sp.]|uniref:translation initiation factor IF-2 n=1 Tax=uncultured Streptomyces sp. TaxID=174707 RepID=UPI0026125144|nr:translation initiation factor IF-2 [uncultured Streptomyces sp.]
MSHEQMLAWLDRANSGAVQGAADRLKNVAAEIAKIASELKVRPQMVEWKGDGAEAFRTWSADLANATLRLGEYSEGAAKWLSEASNAVATAQAAIPRTHGGAQANLDAARAARNDPDASAVAREAAETLLRTSENNRLDAAAEMSKLAQAYAVSSTEMDKLERPVFPPPPAAITPDPRSVVSDDDYVRDGTTGGSGSTGLANTHRAATVLPSATATPDSGRTEIASLGTAPSVLPTGRPTEMEINSVAAPVETRPAPGLSAPAVPVTAGPDTGVTPPPVANRPGVLPVSGPGASVGKTPGGGRAFPSVTGTTSAPGASARPVRDGITGGRPVAPATGRATAGGLPRGTVIGHEGQAAAGRAMGSTGSSTGGTARGGMQAGRRLGAESGGMVGGRPQQAGRAGSRAFTPGGTGLVRGSAGEAGGARGAGAVGRPGASQRPGTPRRNENGERPDYLVEDEETWQQGVRPSGPPVIG